MGAQAFAGARNSITALNASRADNGAIIIKVEFAQPLAHLPAGAGFTINIPNTPPRIVLDFSDMENGLGKSVQDFAIEGLRSVNIVRDGGRIRLVVNLKQIITYNARIDGGSLLIVLQGNTVEQTPQIVQKREAEAMRQPVYDKEKIAVHTLLRKLVQDADGMVKSGKAAEAYALLEPHEDDYSGEIQFDYVLGIAALDSTKPDRATIAFERVLAVNPDFAGARIDLARAYFAMGSDDLAKHEFQTVLAQNPPEQVAAVLNKYIEAIDARRNAKIQKLAFYLETNMGRDSNITAATKDFTGGVFEAFPPNRSVASGSSLHYAGMYTGVSGGVDFMRVVSEENGVSLFAGADVRQRVYNDVNAMNNLNLDLRAGVSVAKDADSYRLIGSLGQFRQTGFINAANSTAGTNSFSDTAGLGAEWKHNFGTRDQMTWLAQYKQPRYTHGSTDFNPSPEDTNQVSLSASWLHIFEMQAAPLIFANLNRSVDKALRALNTSTASSRTRTTSGMFVHLQCTPLSNTDFFLSGGLTVRHDDSPYARSVSPSVVAYARDITRNISIGATTRPWPKWSIKGTVALTDNISNLSLYQYYRVDSSVSLRRDF